MIITLFRTGKDGRTHYYTVHDRQPLLDSAFSLCAAWRIGLGKEREKLHRFDSRAERDAMIRRLIAARLKQGYRLLYTFSRAGYVSRYLDKDAEGHGERRIGKVSGS